MKKSLLFLSSLLLFFCLLIFPARTFFYACEGVNLWFHTILLFFWKQEPRGGSLPVQKFFFKRFSVFPRLGFMHFFSVFSAVFPWERASLPSSMRQKKLTGTKRAIF